MAGMAPKQKEVEQRAEEFIGRLQEPWCTDYVVSFALILLREQDEWWKEHRMYMR